jgi:putative PIN family toxin of toxin-antitoxin system
MINTTYIFLDTNVYLRFLPHSKLGDLLKKLLPFKIIVSKELLEEIKRVSLYPSITKQIPLIYLDDYILKIPIALEAIKQNADIFINNEIPILVEEPVSDPNDWYITNIGIQYNCTIITDDSDILNMENTSFPVLSIKSFLSSL